MWPILLTASLKEEPYKCVSDPTVATLINCQIPLPKLTLEFFITLFDKPKDQVLKSISFLDSENKAIEIRSYRLRAIQYRPKLGQDSAGWKKLFLEKNDSFELGSSYRRLRFTDCFSLPLDNVQVDHRGFADMTNNDDIVWQFRAFFSVSNVRLNVSIAPGTTIDESISQSAKDPLSFLLPVWIGTTIFGSVLIVILVLFVRNKIKDPPLNRVKRKTSDPDLMTASSIELTSEFVETTGLYN